tara:strand:- start:1178 stop:1936 length:759 start_codon:yes stop_codon:yes gene_type:complete
MTELIQTSIENKVLTITFNRIAKKNALTHAMYTAMADAMEDARSNDGVRAILFTGVEDVFTAGNDLIDFQQSGGLDGARPVMRFLSELVESDKPLVAAVNGLAVGIGLTMLLHCDLVYMAENATLSAPFVDLALVPENASSLLLPQAVGHVRAAEIFMFGKKVKADEAFSMGLVNEITSLDEVLNTARKAAETLARKAPISLQTTKSLMRGDKQVLKDRIEQEGGHFSTQLKSAEVMEAIAAFFEKRPPNFD